MAVKNGGKAIFGKSRQMTLWIPWGSKTVSKIYMFLCFVQKFKMAAKNGGKMNFWKSRQMATNTLGAKNFDEIDQSHTISQINASLRLTQKFNMTNKTGGKAIFGKNR